MALFVGFLCRLMDEEPRAIDVAELEGILVLLVISSFEVPPPAAESLSIFSYFEGPGRVLKDLNMARSFSVKGKILIDRLGMHRHERRRVGVDFR